MIGRPGRGRGEEAGRPVSNGETAAEAATRVHRFAVLLEAGLAPARAWEHVGAAADADVDSDSPGGATAHARPAASVHPADLAETLASRRGAWHEVAVAWRVASTVGAPLAPSLRSIAEALRDAEQAREDVAVALAEPASTARLIGWLPLLAVVLVAAFGFDVAGAIATPAGGACVVSGAALMIASRRWTRRLVRLAQPAPGIAGWECDLVGIALSGGVSIDRAIAVVERAGCATARDATADVLALSRASGAPAVELLRADAREQRRAARTRGRLLAARLSSRLLLPLGVCTLPAFLLLGVAPMMLAVLAAGPVVY